MRELCKVIKSCSLSSFSEPVQLSKANAVADEAIDDEARTRLVSGEKLAADHLLAKAVVQSVRYFAPTKEEVANES